MSICYVKNQIFNQIESNRFYTNQNHNPNLQKMSRQALHFFLKYLELKIIIKHSHIDAKGEDIWTGMF